jgi:PAS domain S-box-containing protein
VEAGEAPLDETAEELYEDAPCGYLSTRPDGTIVRVNRTFLAWTGYDREGLLAGKRFQDLLIPAGKIFYETHYAPLLQMQGFVNEIAVDLACADRRLMPVLINSARKTDASGTHVLTRTAVFNATDRREYERELLLARHRAEQAARTKADFLSMLSHEIRNPVSAIIPAVRLLERTGTSPDQEKLIRSLKSASERLLGLVNDILDFSKIEAGKVSLEQRPFNVRQLISGILFSLAARAEEKGLAVEVDIDERVPACLVGDPIKIGQVLANLVSNAIKFTESGSVAVAVQVREDLSDAVSVDFRVTDTGIGIAKDRLVRIFEEYAQAGADVSWKYGGTGLGLAISRKLLGLYGSGIVVQSVPGQGSTFTFNLRLKVGHEVS